MKIRHVLATLLAATATFCAAGVAGKGRAIGMRRLRVRAAGQFTVRGAANGDSGGQCVSRFSIHFDHRQAMEAFTSGYTAVGDWPAEKQGASVP